MLISLNIPEELNQSIAKFYKEINLFNNREIIDEISERTLLKIQADLNAYLINDPATKGTVELVTESYRCFSAVLHYRIANAIMEHENSLENTVMARKISEYSKIRTGIEIHPSAKIGVPFIIDHGYGTVIGETCEIGDNCYILNNVTLGAISIKNNKDQIKRHPTIGNNVQIGAAASVYGPVTVGDGCFIGPYAVVTQDIPSNTNVIVRFRFQELHWNGNNTRVLGLIPNIERNEILVLGENFPLSNLKCVLLESKSVSQISVKLKLESSRKFIINFIDFNNHREGFRLLFTTDQGESIFSLIISPNIFS